MEHLRRVCKEAVATLSDVQSAYDKELGIAESSGHHTVASTNKDKNYYAWAIIRS